MPLLSDELLNGIILMNAITTTIAVATPLKKNLTFFCLRLT